MSSPPPNAIATGRPPQPVTDFTAELGDTRVVERLADLPTEPGQDALGPTADNDVDLLRRHLAEDMPSDAGTA
jgi:hypothetical protein